MRLFKFFLCIFIATSCSTPTNYDILIKNGTIADGSGNTTYVGDIGINADTIAAVGHGLTRRPRRPHPRYYKSLRHNTYNDLSVSRSFVITLQG